MALTGTEAVRQLATDRYVLPSRSAGKSTFTIRVADLKKELVSKGFPPNHTPQICNALRSRRFLQANGLELVATDGPPSKTSTTVVFHYRVQTESEAPGGNHNDRGARDAFHSLRGMLKDVIREAGGAHQYLREIRGEDREL